MPSLVFICVANSARSQMAEGLARAMAPDDWDVYSAGSEPAAVNPLAVAALAEKGIDASGHTSKGLADVPLGAAAAVITLCAEEQCPILPPKVRRVSWPLPDPARVDGSDEQRLEAFRAARDEIERRLSRLWNDRGELALE